MYEIHFHGTACDQFCLDNNVHPPQYLVCLSCYRLGSWVKPVAALINKEYPGLVLDMSDSDYWVEHVNAELHDCVSCKGPMSKAQIIKSIIRREMEILEFKADRERCLNALKEDNSDVINIERVLAYESIIKDQQQQLDDMKEYLQRWFDDSLVD